MLAYIRSVTNNTHLDRVDITIKRAKVLIEPIRRSYARIFTDELERFPPIRAVKADKDTTETNPMHKAPYRLSLTERRELKGQILKYSRLDSFVPLHRSRDHLCSL